LNITFKVSKDGDGTTQELNSIFGTTHADSYIAVKYEYHLKHLNLCILIPWNGITHNSLVIGNHDFNYSH